MARYLSFIAYACATTFLPGPNNILMMTQASRYGVKKLWPLLFGIWSGLLAVMLLAGAFCAGLSSFVPRFAAYFKYVGGAYILYLAWKTLRRGGMNAGDAKDVPLTYANGFLLQFLNVKVIMLGLASFPGYFLPMGNSLWVVLLFAVTMTVCCGMGNLIWTFLGSILTPFYNRYYKVINLVMALLLVWCAWKIVR